MFAIVFWTFLSAGRGIWALPSTVESLAQIDTGITPTLSTILTTQIETRTTTSTITITLYGANNSVISTSVPSAFVPFASNSSSPPSPMSKIHNASRILSAPNLSVVTFHPANVTPPAGPWTPSYPHRTSPAQSTAFVSNATKNSKTVVSLLLGWFLTLLPGI